MECNNLPWPMAVLDWGRGCQQGTEDPAVGGQPDFKNHVANIQWKSQLELQSMVGKACYSAEG